MAGEIASVVLEIARFIYEVYQANLELEEQEREMARSCTVLTAAVKGLTHAENFTPALEQMRDALMSAKRTVTFLMQRRAGGKKWHVKPQVQLDELARHSATLQRVAGELTLALTAHLVRSADAAAADDVKFDNLRVLAHSSAKKFWQRNAGPYARDIKTRTFLQAFRHEYGQNSAVMTDENLELLKHQVDSSDDGTVSIYELARFTDKLGLLRSFIELVESVTRKPPPSTGTIAEILRRTILVEGAYLSDFQSSTPLRDAIEATCTIIKYARIEPTGVMIEMIEDDIADSIARMEIPEAVRHRRLAFRAVAHGTQIVDQILEMAAKAREEAEVKTQATTESKETTGADKLALEVKLLEEEHEMKQEVSNNSHRSALVQLEVKYQQDLKSCRADSKLTAATRPRVEAELRKKFEAEKAKASESWRVQASALRKQEDEAREAALASSPFKKGLMDLLGTSPKKVAAEFHGRFPQAPPDEDPADRWYAVEDAGMSVGRYGYLYCTQAGLYFWSGSLTGTQFRREVSFQQLFVVEKTSYVWFPTALTITFRVEGAHTKEVQFRDFSDRESAFKVIEQQWKNYAEQMLKGKIQQAKTKSWYVPSSGLTVHHEGFLDKKGDVIKNYKRRWFTLTSRGLAYAVSKDAPTIKQISIITVADVRVDEKGTTAEKYPFHVLTEKRTWHLVAASTRERVEWVAKIKEVVAAQRFSFFYGLITNDPPAHVVMEFRFAERALNIMIGGIVKSTIPFSSIQSVEADVQSLGFTILRADKDSRHALCAQSAEERDELVATLNHLVEEMRTTAESKLGLEGDIVEDKGDESVGLLDFSGVQIALTRLQSTALHLLKKGAVEIIGQGKTRYLYLEQIGSLARLLIYQSDTAIAPLEVINLPRTAVCKSIGDNKNMLLHAMGRSTMTLRFPSQPIRDEWFTCIAVVMRAINAGLTAQLPSSPGGVTISGSFVNSPTMGNLNFSGERMSPIATDGDGQSSRPPMMRGASVEPLLSRIGANAAANGNGELGSMLSPRSPQQNQPASPTSPMSAPSTPSGPNPLEAEVRQLQSQLAAMRNQTSDLSRQVADSEGRVRDTQRIAADTEKAYRDMESQLKMAAAEKRSEQQRTAMMWLRQGALMNKFSKGKSNERFVIYRDGFPDAVGPVIGWAESKKNADKNKMHYIPTNEIKDVRPGFGTTQFGVQKPDKEVLSFSIIADLRSLDLMTDSVQARDYWVAALRDAVGLGPIGPTEQLLTGGPAAGPPTPSTAAARR